MIEHGWCVRPLPRCLCAAAIKIHLCLSRQKANGHIHPWKLSFNRKNKAFSNTTPRFEGDHRLKAEPPSLPIWPSEASFFLPPTRCCWAEPFSLRASNQIAHKRQQQKSQFNALTSSAGSAVVLFSVKRMCSCGGARLVFSATDCGADSVSGAASQDGLGWSGTSAWSHSLVPDWII